MNFLVHILASADIATKNDTKQMEYVNSIVPKAVRAARDLVGISTVQYEIWGIEEFSKIVSVSNIKGLPAFGIQIEGVKESVFLEGYYTYDSIVNYCTSVFKTGKAPKIEPYESGTAIENGNGTGGNGTGGNGFGLGTRDCNAIDKLLDSVGFGTIRQVLYIGGAAFFAYRATGTSSKSNQAINGAAAAGLLYLGLKNPLC